MYEREKLAALSLDLSTEVDKLHAIIENASDSFHSDSSRSLFRESFILLMRCQQGVYEFQELEQADSLMFEMYGR